MSTQTKFTPIQFSVTDCGDWQVSHDEWRNTGYRTLSVGLDFAAHGEVVVFIAEGYNKQWAEAGINEASDKVLAAITSHADLYAALEALTDFTEWSLARSELYAEEFRRETGMLAPFKDAGAMANEAEELHASRAEEWRAWCKRKRETMVNNARTALKSARGEG